MAVINQTKPRDLETYYPDTDNVSLTDTYIILDSPYWERPKKYQAENTGMVTIQESIGQLSNLTSKTVIVEFSTEFDSRPIEILLKAYRWENNRKQEVPFEYNGGESYLTTSQFSIIIDRRENLDGIIIDYNFKSK
jgi:hypothetical protein